MKYKWKKKKKILLAVPFGIINWYECNDTSRKTYQLPILSNNTTCCCYFHLFLILYKVGVIFKKAELDKLSNKIGRKVKDYFITL